MNAWLFPDTRQKKAWRQDPLVCRLVRSGRQKEIPADRQQEHGREVPQEN